METIDGLGPFQLYGDVPRRSSSVSPTEEPGPRPNKRRRVSQFFGQDSRSTSDDEDDEPSRRPKHRKSSAFLSLFSLPKATRKDSKYDKMPATDTDYEQGRHNEVPLAQRSVPYDTSDTPIEPERRRSSLARIKEFFSRKRNDSGVQENTVSNKAAPWNCHPLAPGNANPHHQMEVQYYNTSLEPLAMGTSGRYYAQQSANLAAEGWLRFKNQSCESLLGGGPSNFYQTQTYRDRPCTVLSQSIYSRPTRADSVDWFADRVPTPTFETNLQASAEQCYGFGSHSPPLSRFRSYSRQNSMQLQMPTFFKGKRSIARTQRSARGSVYSPPPVTRNFAVRRPSRTGSVTPSIFSTRKFSTNPHPFGKEPDLRLRSIDELGVLPLIEASSVESSPPAPHSWLLPNASATSSTVALHLPSAPSSADSSAAHSPARALHPDIQCSFSPTINPSHFAPTEPNSFLLLPSPQFAAPPATATRLPSMLSLAESPLQSQQSLSTTLPDLMSEHDSLGLRRMTSSLVDALSSFNIEGDGRLEWGESGGAEAELIGVRPSDGVAANDFVIERGFEGGMDGEECEESRGRSVVREGEGVVVW